MREMYRWVGMFVSSVCCERLPSNILLPFLLILFSWAVPGRTSLRAGAWQHCISSLTAKLQEVDITLWFWVNISPETFLSSSGFCPVFIELFLFNHASPFASYYVIASGRLCSFLGRDETLRYFCLQTYLRENALVRYSFYMYRTRTFLHKAFQYLELRCALMVALFLLLMLGVGPNTNIKTCVKSVSHLCLYHVFLWLSYLFCPLNAKISLHCLWNILFISQSHFWVQTCEVLNVLGLWSHRLLKYNQI